MEELENRVTILEDASSHEKRCKCKGTPKWNALQGISDEQPSSFDEWNIPDPIFGSLPFFILPWIRFPFG
jgi:hypothetical protein